MSMHKKPLTPLEEEGLRKHGLAIGTPSQLSDVFRHGVAWALSQQAAQPVALTERAAFEAWAGDQGYPMRRIHAGEDDSGYLDLRTEGAWGAWMARAAQQPAQPVAQQLSREQIGDIVREHLRGLYY